MGLPCTLNHTPISKSRRVFPRQHVRSCLLLSEAPLRLQGTSFPPLVCSKPLAVRPMHVNELLHVCVQCMLKIAKIECHWSKCNPVLLLACQQVLLRRLSSSSSSSSSSEAAPLVTLAPLSHRSLLLLRGADSAPFLQGLLTADLALLQPAGALYSMLLNAQVQRSIMTLLFSIMPCYIFVLYPLVGIYISFISIVRIGG